MHLITEFIIAELVERGYQCTVDSRLGGDYMYPYPFNPPYESKTGIVVGDDYMYVSGQRYTYNLEDPNFDPEEFFQTALGDFPKCC